MNKLKGYIREIKVSGKLSRVTVELTQETRVSAIVIETPDTAAYLQKKQPVSVLFKETEVILVRDPKVKISLENRIPGKISHVGPGALFCEIVMHTPAGEVRALISRGILDQWPLQPGDEVTAMVKMNEIMLQE